MSRDWWPKVWMLTEADVEHACAIARSATATERVLRRLPVAHPDVLAALASRDPASTLVRRIVATQLTGGPYTLCRSNTAAVDDRAQVWAGIVAGVPWLTRRRFELLLRAPGTALAVTATGVVPRLSRHRLFTRAAAGTLLDSTAACRDDRDLMMRAVAACGPSWALLAAVFTAVMDMAAERPGAGSSVPLFRQVGAALERAGDDTLRVLPALLTAMPDQPFPAVLALAHQVSAPASRGRPRPAR